MSKETQRWKNSERQLAEILNKYGILAKRISRGSNYSVSTYDVEIEGHPEFKLDSKYSIKGFKTSRLLDVVREKYCKEKQDIPVVFCKAYKEVGGKVTIEAEFFAKLLANYLGLKPDGE